MSKPIESNEMKLFKGQEIWVIPQVNAIKRNKPLIEQITSAIVEKCGSKMFHLKKVCNGYGGSYSFEDYCNSDNFGYMPFKSKQDALDYLEVDSFLSELKNKDLSHLGIEDVRKIKEIIENKLESEIK